MTIKIRDAEFIAGATSAASFPTRQAREVAFLGRSNVGKSSLINRLTGRKQLARVSATPGRTTQFNFFKIVLFDENRAEVGLNLVDLPGFGFAKFAKEERELLWNLTDEYLTQREQLKVACLLNDSRRLPGEEELHIRETAFNGGRHVLVVLTKCDRLSQKELNIQCQAIAKAYNLQAEDVLTSGEEEPVDNIWSRVLAILK